MSRQVYEDQAARQRAWRAREKAKAAARVAAGFEAKYPPTLTPMLQYRQWRKATGEAMALLERVYEELEAFMQERSERWHESDRGGELEAEKDELYGVLDTLAGLEVLKPDPR